MSNKVQYAITIALSVVSGVLVWVVKGLLSDNRRLRESRKNENVEREKAIKGGVLSLLRIQLIEYHDKYMTRNTVPVYVLDNWDEMFKSYIALGGNGTIKRMNDDINKLRLGGAKNENN